METAQKKEDSGKKEGRKIEKVERQVMWLFAIFGVLILGFLIGYFLLLPKPYFEYHGLKVYPTKLEGFSTIFYALPLKSASGNNGTLVLRSDPRRLENITLNINESLYGGIEKIWFTTDPDMPSSSTLAMGEIGRFVTFMGVNTSFALTRNSTNIDQIDCTNATSSVRVIEIRLGNETRVYSEGYCIIVEGEDSENVIAAADRLTFSWVERILIGTKKQ